MKNLTWQNPEQLFVAQELINKVKSKCCGIKVYLNQYMNALKCKYQQGIQKLIQHGATTSEIAPYRQTIRFYYFKKTWSVIGIPVCLGVFVFIVILLTT